MILPRRPFNSAIDPSDKKAWSEFLLQLNLTLDDLYRNANVAMYSVPATLVYENVLAAAVNSIDITGLTVAAWGGIFFEWSILNSSGGGSLYYQYYNGNTTAANYFRVGYGTTGAADGLISSNGTPPNGSIRTYQGILTVNPAYASNNVIANVNTYGTDNVFAAQSHRFNTGAQVTDVTQINLRPSAGANSFGIGSRFRIWRRS